jgi:hypothetical protein
MNWVTAEGGNVGVATSDQVKEYEDEKATSLPVIEKESENGAKPFKPIEFQPVESPGIYEAEFGVKGEDVIFHFWPHGYRKAAALGKTTPHFLKDFRQHVATVMLEDFGNTRVEFQDDKDVGAFFVKANGWGKNEFHRELCIKACEKIHAALGGKPG